MMKQIIALLVLYFLMFTANGYAVSDESVHIIKIASNTQLDKKVIKLALEAYHYATVHAAVSKPILTIIDYSQPSVRKRLYVIDLKTDKLLMNTLVAHGRNSGDALSMHFSNQEQSKQSSVGVFVTEGVYFGHHGKSMVINGLEKNINDNAKRRNLVVHAAQYVSEAFIQATGRIGRSLGCLAVGSQDINKLIDLTEKGSVIFSYAPQEDNDYLLKATKI
jgi:hypothetical protein